MMQRRVYLRGVPKELAGVPVSSETLHRIKARLEKVIPERPLERPISDLLAHAYMAGMIDALADPRVDRALTTTEPSAPPPTTSPKLKGGGENDHSVG